MRIRHVYLLIAVLLAFPGFSQQLPFRSYTVSHGLVTNAIRRIYQDHQGYLWIATWEGLSKYDGYRFTNYNIYNGLPYSMVNDITELPDSSLIVCMNNGSVCIIRDGIIKFHPHRGVTINKFYNDRGRRIIGITDITGVLSIKNGQITKPVISDSATLYAWNKYDENWYLGAGERCVVSLYDTSLRRVYQLAPSAPIPTCIFRDHSGRVWIGTESGLRSLNVRLTPAPALTWQDLPEPFNNKLLANSSISSIDQDEEGAIWFGTWNGLVRITPDGKLDIFDEKDGLPSRKISYIYRDKEKNLWVGTYAGLAKFAHSSIQTVKLPEAGNINGNYDLKATGAGEFLLTSSSGIFRYRSNTKTFENIFPTVHITPALVEQKKGYTFFYRNEMMEVNLVSGKISSVRRFDKKSVIFCAGRKDSVIVLGLGDGLRIIMGEKELDTLRPFRINKVMIDSRGRIWAGCWTAGLFLIEVDHKAGKILSLKNMSTELSDRAIRSLLEDDKGRIWVGTRYNGINILVPEGDRFRVLHISQQNGLCSNWINCFTEGASGVVWAGSLGGINKLIPSATGYRVFNYSRVGDYFATVSKMVMENDSTIWCITDKGLIRVRDRRLETTAPMEVFITRMEVNNQDSNYASADLAITRKIRYSENNVHFEFTSPGFINENELHYKYRLIGSSDTNWSLASNTHSVQYASLEPGKYRFEVCMIGWNGETGPIRTLPFAVAAPFWQTAWFYGLLAAAVLLLFYLFYRYRIRQLVKLHRVRNSIATDLHDDIGASLTNINILSRLSLQHINEPDNARKFLTRIAEQVQGSSEALDDIIWSVNTRHDSMSETIARMRRHAADLFDNTPLVCRLSLPEFAEDTKLSMELRRDLFLVYKEILNNVNKHANAKTVDVSLQKTDREIELTVKDDGIGFDFLQTNDRNGLKNIGARAKKWNGWVHIESLLEKGTVVTVVFRIER